MALFQAAHAGLLVLDATKSLHNSPDCWEALVRLGRQKHAQGICLACRVRVLGLLFDLLLVRLAIHSVCAGTPLQAHILSAVGCLASRLVVVLRKDTLENAAARQTIYKFHGHAEGVPSQNQGPATHTLPRFVFLSPLPATAAEELMCLGTWLANARQVHECCRLSPPMRRHRLATSHARCMSMHDCLSGIVARSATLYLDSSCSQRTSVATTHQPQDSDLDGKVNAESCTLSRVTPQPLFDLPILSPGAASSFNKRLLGFLSHINAQSDLGAPPALWHCHFLRARMEHLLQSHAA